MSGCIFSPKKGVGGGIEPPPVYLANITPEAVLTNLAKAYAARDSIEFKLLYDDKYTGETIDQTNPGSPLSLPFTKADEVGHISGLAHKTTVASVELQLKALVRQDDAGQGYGWALFQNPVASLTVFDTPTSWTITPDAETIEFHLIPTPDSSSPTDTTWKIIKWTEVLQ